MTESERLKFNEGLAHKLSFAPQFHTQITTGQFAGAWTLVCAPVGLSFTQVGLQQWMLEAMEERKRIEDEGAVTVLFDFKGEIGSHERISAPFGYGDRPAVNNSEPIAKLSAEALELQRLAQSGDDVAAAKFRVIRWNTFMPVGASVFYTKSEIEGKVRLATAGPAYLFGDNLPSIDLTGVGRVLLDEVEAAWD